MKKTFWSLVIGYLSLVPRPAAAHVGYVLSREEFARQSGTNWTFLLEPLNHATDVLIIVGTLCAAAVLYFGALRIKKLVSKFNQITKKAESYHDLVPWMLRLGLGIALIGAGLNNSIISPVLSGFPEFREFEILLGFFLLLGFLTAPALWLTIGLFLSALFREPYILGNAEFLAAAIALIILAERRPGLDDLIDIPFFAPLTIAKKYAPFILRLGIGGAMTYLAIYEKFLNPQASALVVVKTHLTSVVPVSPNLWVLGAGLVEVAIGLALIAGFKTRLFAVLAFAVLSLSFFYFGEDVYSHITLFSVLSAVFVYGGGKLSIDENRAK